MKVTQNLHTHSSFCDGANTLEEMIQAAVRAGLSSLGFSGHAYTPHDISYCMSADGTLQYYSELLRLREKYADTIQIYIGLEQDYFSAPPTIPCDYIIGSVHYVYKSGEYIDVDDTKEKVTSAVKRLYGGDVYSYLEDYYSLVSDVYNKTNCDIVGHFDLPEKFNADNSMFDRAHPRYVSAYRKAMRELVRSGRIFEINTGGMSRGYTTQPYPRQEILREMCALGGTEALGGIEALGGKVCVSSDSHSTDTINYKLGEAAQIACSAGFKKIYVLTSDGSKKIWSTESL